MPYTDSAEMIKESDERNESKLRQGRYAEIVCEQELGDEMSN